jgi:hypothetical protein
MHAMSTAERSTVIFPHVGEAGATMRRALRRQFAKK